jgi:carbon monoxide dehydrogenase subunit G
MKLSGEQTIPAPRQRVWEGLNDPQILKQCIKGCEYIKKTSDTAFAARVIAKVGPVKARFNGQVTLTNLNPPQSYTISGQGEGGVAGFARGKSDVRLIEVGPQETRMTYDVDAQIGGKLAMIGSRLIDSTAQSMAEQFFDRFVTLMAGKEKAKAPAKPAEKKGLRAAVKKIARKLKRR